MIAIIPARGGSRRIPKKNIKDFHGKPIISYSIEAAKESGLFDEIIVSTDSKEIALKVVETRDCTITIHNRSDEMSQDEVGTQEVVSNVLKDMDIDCEYVCCIYATAPLISINDLVSGFHVLKEGNYNYTFSVGTNPLCDAGQFYWGRADSFLRNHPLIAPHTTMIPISDQRVCDINTMDDWYRAEKMYESLSSR